MSNTFDILRILRYSLSILSLINIVLVLNKKILNMLWPVSTMLWNFLLFLFLSCNLLLIFFENSFTVLLITLVTIYDLGMFFYSSFNVIYVMLLCFCQYSLKFCGHSLWVLLYVLGPHSPLLRNIMWLYSHLIVSALIELRFPHCDSSWNVRWCRAYAALSISL